MSPLTEASEGRQRRRESGAPALLTLISEKRMYRKTGRKGLDGYIDYLAKNIDKNAQRRRGRPIGEIFGRTKELEEASQ